MNVRLYLVQRATALLMVPLIVGHLAIIFYATRRGLTADDILGRTRGSVGWAFYYATFVIAASTHGAIGLRTIAMEWGGLRGRSADLVMWIAGLILASLGLRAVYAVALP
ncbi:MAG: succinate dehydrogenase [Hyphomicrobiaceae bacterium]